MYIKFFNWIQTYNYIEFKYFWKYNIICVLLVNTTMCLNSIEKPNVPNKLYLSFTRNEIDNFVGK